MRWIATWTVAVFVSAAALADALPAAPELTAAQIVEKNIVARGGLDAWKKVQSMVWLGHIESVNAPMPNLPFVLELKRPNKERFEIRAHNQMSVRTYDGAHGWKVRPGGKGGPDVKPYSDEELKSARDTDGIDGPLVDYQAKGSTVALEGIDEVEGRKAYRLKVTLASGASHHVWVDAGSFLDIKYDRLSHNSFGMSGLVSVFNRDFRAVDGLQLPFLIESGVGSAKTTDKMVIDKIVLNPPLDDRMFARPAVTGRRNLVEAEPLRPMALRPGASMPAGIPGMAPRSLSGLGEKR